MQEGESILLLAFAPHLSRQPSKAIVQGTMAWQHIKQIRVTPGQKEWGEKCAAYDREFAGLCTIKPHWEQVVLLSHPVGNGVNVKICNTYTLLKSKIGKYTQYKTIFIESLTSLDFQPVALFSYPSISYLVYSNGTHHKQILSIPGETCSQKEDVLVHKKNFQL